MPYGGDGEFRFFHSFLLRQFDFRCAWRVTAAAGWGSHCTGALAQRGLTRSARPSIGRATLSRDSPVRLSLFLSEARFLGTKRGCGDANCAHTAPSAPSPGHCEFCLQQQANISVTCVG